jgi:hypothetical protein
MAVQYILFYCHLTDPAMYTHETESSRIANNRIVTENKM